MICIMAMDDGCTHCQPARTPSDARSTSHTPMDSLPEDPGPRPRHPTILGHRRPDAPLCRICQTLDGLLRTLTRAWHIRPACPSPPAGPSGPGCRLCFGPGPSPAPSQATGTAGLCAPCQSRLTTAQAVAADWRALTRDMTNRIDQAPPSGPVQPPLTLQARLSQCRVWVFNAHPGDGAQTRPNPFTESSPSPSTPFTGSLPPAWRLWLLASQYEALLNPAERRAWGSARPPVGFKLRRRRAGRWDILTCGAWARDQRQPMPDPDPLTVTCLVCAQTWPSLQSGIDHALDHDGEARLHPQPRPSASTSGVRAVVESDGQSCGICGQVFFKSSQLQNHLRAHRGEKPFQCDLCHKGFTRKAYYLEHRARHDGVKDKECHICQKKFYATSFYRHMATVHPESERLQHACSTCGKHFPLKYKLQIHEKTHIAYEERAFACENCPEKRFSTQSHLNNHINQVHGLKGLSRPFLCPDCGQSFNAQSTLEAHRAKHHLNPEQNVHACSACPSSFPTLTSLKNHAQMVHPPSAPNPETFGSHAPGASHIELLLPEVDPGLAHGSIMNPTASANESTGDLVAGSQIHGPDLVESTLTAGANLADSIVVEENGLPKILLRTNEGDFLVPLEFKDHVEGEDIDPKDLDHYLCGTGQTIGQPGEVSCESCGKTFQTRKAKSQHIRNVHSQKTFSCATCPKTFANRHYLKMHEKVHTTEKHIACPVCQKLFKFDKDLKKHMRTHTGEKPYRCSDCGKTFTNTSNLAEHRTLHTGRLNYPCPNCNRRFRIWTSMNKHYLRGQCSRMIPEEGESTTLVVNSDPSFDLGNSSIPVEDTQIYVINGVL